MVGGEGWEERGGKGRGCKGKEQSKKVKYGKRKAIAEIRQCEMPHAYTYLFESS